MFRYIVIKLNAKNKKGKIVNSKRLIANFEAYRNSWTLDARVGRCTLDARLGTLDPGRWTLDSRPWTLDSGLWPLDPGLWMLDPGRYTLDAGL